MLVADIANLQGGSVYLLFAGPSFAMLYELRFGVFELSLPLPRNHTKKRDKANRGEMEKPTFFCV
jgi:hypothetical protein